MDKLTVRINNPLKKLSREWLDIGDQIDNLRESENYNTENIQVKTGVINLICELVNKRTKIEQEFGSDILWTLKDTPF